MLRLSSPTGSGPPLHHSAVHEVIHRFFIYDDDAITMRRWNEACVARFLNRSAAKLVKGVEDDGEGGLCACNDDWVADALLLAQLKAHPARTASPSEAQLFVIPTPFYQSFACDATSTRKRSDVHTRRVQGALRALEGSKWFGRYGGHDHILPAHGWQFAGWAQDRIPASRLMRSKCGIDHRCAWGLLENVTVARNEYYGYGRFEKRLPSPRLPAALATGSGLWELTRRTLVVPYSTPTSLLTDWAPSLAAWWRRNTSIFFHTRRGSPPLAHGSEALRFLAAQHPAQWPSSDVGFRMPHGRWLTAWATARWCLVMRGDTPTSHAFYNAIAGGCLPVVISDGFEAVGSPPFGIVLESLAVVVSETSFTANPNALLSMLEALPEPVVAAKLRALAAAQPKLLYRHPHSVVASLLLDSVARLISGSG